MQMRTVANTRTNLHGRVVNELGRIQRLEIALGVERRLQGRQGRQEEGDLLGQVPVFDHGKEQGEVSFPALLISEERFDHGRDELKLLRVEILSVLGLTEGVPELVTKLVGRPTVKVPSEDGQ